MTKPIIRCAWILALSGNVCRSGDADQLANATLALKLGTDSTGTPLVTRVEWSRDHATIFEADAIPAGLAAWLPTDVLPKTEGVPDGTVWRISEDTHLHRAEATQELSEGLRVTWVVELAKQGSLFRMYVRMANGGPRSRPVEWFPGWRASWRMSGDAEGLRYWKALSFDRVDRSLSAGQEVGLRSRLHSSDEIDGGGMNPYWIVSGRDCRLYFGLAWCGGWEAKLSGRSQGIQFSVRLPPSETQLTLAPGQEIAGPIVEVTALRGTDEMTGRAEWMAQRAALARSLYGGPAPSYPLSYNNWYVTRFNVSADFLRRQVAAMAPYGFDAFVVDAGWYGKTGQWTPDIRKFGVGGFEAILASARAQGARTGVWTCPAYINAPKGGLPPGVDVPDHYEEFFDGHLLDLTGVDFKRVLTGHVAMLRKRCRADWWKYDGNFFVPRSRAGVMRNVVSFQDALLAVRKDQPDLFIENCQGGARMLNEVTLLATQATWLRDGGGNGLGHARENIATVLGALDIVFPWAAERWTNNLQKMDPNDEELTRYYCRSAMPGTWGIVSDLSAIPQGQRAVILKEIRHYRRLNGLKPGCLYELALPAEKRAVVGITFYTPARSQAAILLCRWNGRDELDHPVRLAALREGSRYGVEDVDSGVVSQVDVRTLRGEGIRVRFSSSRMSALVFVQAVP